MAMLAGSSVLCFRRCPGYLKCIVMYAQYRFRRYMRWAAEAELLSPLRNWSIPLNGDRWLNGRQGMQFNKADLYSDWRERSMILSPEGVWLMLLCRGVCYVYHVHHFYLGGKFLLPPCSLGEALHHHPRWASPSPYVRRLAWQPI